METLSGNKDTDLLILSNLDDRSLLNMCLIKNKYINSLCNNEDFWRNRFIKVFGLHASNYKPNNRSWKRHYLTVISDLDELSSEMDGDNMRIFHELVERLADIGSAIKDKSEKIMNGYWLLDLGVGKEITIGYPVDRYGDITPEIRTYKAPKKPNNDNFFTASDIVKFIEDFYNEKVSPDDLQEQLDVDNPYADGYTLDDARQGNIKRIDLIPMFFEGFSLYDGAYHINLGS